MGQIFVTDLDDGIIERLKRRAAQGNESLEQTVRSILSDAVQMTKAEAIIEFDRIRATTKPSAVSSLELLRCFRDGDDPDA